MQEISEDQKSGLLIDELARLPEKTVLDRRKLAKIFTVSERTIKRMIDQDQLPKPAKLGRRKIWLVMNILKHINDQALKAAQEDTRIKCEIKKIRYGV